LTRALPANDPVCHSSVDSTSAAGGAGCVKVTVRVGAPGAVTVTVPVLGAVVVLAVKSTLNEPLPVWLMGMILFMIIHDESLVTLHVMLESTITVVWLDVCVGFHDASLDIVREATGACDTVTVRVSPSAVTVMVPLLGFTPVLVLAAAVILNEPLPVRLAGVTLLMVSHDTSLLTAHVLLDVTSMVAKLTDDGEFHALVESVNTAGGTACVTDTVRAVTPVPDTVIVPVLEAVPVLAAAVILNWPLLEPLGGVTLSNVSHDALLEADHWMLDVTLTIVWLKVDGAFQLAGDIVRLGMAP